MTTPVFLKFAAAYTDTALIYFFSVHNDLLLTAKVTYLTTLYILISELKLREIRACRIPAEEEEAGLQLV